MARKPTKQTCPVLIEDHSVELPEANTPACTLLVNLHNQVVAIGAQMELVLRDRGSVMETQRETVFRLGEIDVRLARMESVSDRIQPMVDKLEIERQRGIGAKLLLKKGHALWAAVIAAVGWAGHAFFGWPKIP